MVRKYTIVIEKDEENWLVSEVVELPGCHTQAKTMDKLLERTKEAIRAYLETDQKKPIEISEEFVGVQQVESIIKNSLELRGFILELREHFCDILKIHDSYSVIEELKGNYAPEGVFNNNVEV